MEKFGVAETQDLDRETCPRCGQLLNRHGKLLLCPVHGSKPFEAHDASKEK